MRASPPACGWRSTGVAFLIAAEAIASTEGLGFRTPRPPLPSMDVILLMSLDHFACRDHELAARCGFRTSSLGPGSSGAEQMSRIVVHGLEKNYGDARVLEGSTSPPRRRVPSLVGASGCGKSDVPAHPARQEQQSGGVVVVGDRPIVPGADATAWIVSSAFGVFHI